MIFGLRQAVFYSIMAFGQETGSLCLMNIEEGRDRNDDFYGVFSDAGAFDYDWRGVFYYETGDV